jgi:hypothetical protein
VDGQEPHGGGEARSSPPWVWAALVALSLVVVTAGAIVGMVTTDDGGGAGGEAAGPTEIGSESLGLPPSPTPTVPALPPTVSVPPLTEEPPVDTGGFGDTGGADTGFTPTTPTIPTDTSGGTSTTTASWPSGQSGYTVVLASVPEGDGRAAADAAAAQAVAAGLSSAGVLRSSDFSSLRPGYWVAYAGVYSTLAEAQTILPQARAAGFASAYTRRVSP